MLFHSHRRADLLRLGSAYGGWWVPETLITEDWICYLAGVGTDISFDLALVERFGCRVWGIDPTPRTAAWVAERDIDQRWTFVPIGVAGEATELRFYAPQNPDHVSHSMKNLQNTDRFFTAEVVTIAALMNRLGHNRIDLLKLDIEGAEHDTIRTMLADGIFPRVLCVEYDQPEPLSWARDTTAALGRSGYDLVKIEEFDLTFVRRQAGRP
jgi:FkbM family methyltransferase